MLLLAMAVCCTINLSAQSIYFDYTNDTNAAYNLSDVRKITFDADLMNLHLQDGSVFSWNVSTIGFYQYDQSSVNVENVLQNANAWDLKLFPNPTADELQLSYKLPKEDKIQITIFDLNGKVVFEKNCGTQNAGENQELLDLRTIPAGAYICRISGANNQISKQILKK